MPETGETRGRPPLQGATAHDVNQYLHVIRLAAEAMQLELSEGRLDQTRMARRLQAILSQVDGLGELLVGRRDAPPPTAPAPAAPQAVAVDDEGTGATPRILVVDDEALSVMMVGEYLSGHGFVVDQAYDGQEALEKCQDQIYDAVVTDIRMPRLDGHALIARLETLQPGTPVIVMTGHLTAARAEELGPNVAEILPKPFDPAMLRDRLARLVPALTAR